MLYLTEHFYQKLETPILYRVRRGRHRMVQVQSVYITTKVVSSNPRSWRGVLDTHYVMKFVSDLRQVGGIHRVLRFPPPIKLTTTNITEILLQVTLNNINQPILSIYSVIREFILI